MNQFYWIDCWKSPKGSNAPEVRAFPAHQYLKHHRKTEAVVQSNPPHHWTNSEDLWPSTSEMWKWENYGSSKTEQGFTKQRGHLVSVYNKIVGGTSKKHSFKWPSAHRKWLCRAKAVATKPEKLSSISGTHMVPGEKQISQVVLCGGKNMPHTCK